jgi:hypothetical protein
MRAVDLRTDRRATVAVLAALAIPVCLGVLGLGIDVSHWAAIRMELQRTADIAALAGAARYAVTADATKALATAATVAELNGLPAGTRTASANGLAETSGGYASGFSFAPDPPRFTATIQAAVPLTFLRLLTPAATQTIAARAVAQVVPRQSGGQACVLTLDGLATGDTAASGLTVSGGQNTVVGMPACDLRSDASIGFNGNPSIDVANIVASGTIGGAPTCPSGGACNLQAAGVPQLPDPFVANYGPALAAMPGTLIPQPSGASLAPPSAGSAYASLSFGDKSSTTLSPGIYYVAGTISINGSATVTGSGVTLVSAGGLTVNGNASVSLSAPDSGPTAGLLYGAASASAGVQFNGDGAQRLVGAFYVPNGDVSIRGNASTPGSCLVVVARTVSLAGSLSLTDSDCATLGVPATYDLPATARLIE